MITRLPKGLERFQKKGKSSEFNPQNYEQVKSSPSLKVQSHESINDTVKLEGALKNGLLGKEWSKFTLKACRSYDKSPQIEINIAWFAHTSILL